MGKHRAESLTLTPASNNGKELPNNLINADHYHGGETKFSVYAKVPALLKLIAGYPWQVIKTFGV